ncbi:DUF6232 family protein [Methylophilus sp. Leaf414]|uniref:DUF6232 family protein n=1 Tax=Methylophilus sp. Leaf414 TaxID=1736371 RepID=UPI0006FB8D2F|nr:DUF6232 family protein [Methylophilus sp. Leaf414]KQT37647.1 hypothetical protein ASG24_01230 [Methylophilus sp. Leaf414]
MQETSLFDDGRVSVSSTRFVADGKTHLISDITSVRLKHTPARRGIADFLFFIGIGQLFTPFSSILPPLLCFLMGFIAWIVAKPKYIVVLVNASGEVNALTRSDQESIKKIIDALNEALSLK